MKRKTDWITLVLLVFATILIIWAVVNRPDARRDNETLRFER